MTGGTATISNNTWVGWSGGTGALNISGTGAMTNNSILYMGKNGGVGTVSLSDNAVLDVSGSLSMGQNGSVGNSITLSDNASLSVGGIVRLGWGDNSDGTMNLFGGTVNLATALRLTENGGTGTVYVSNDVSAPGANDYDSEVGPSAYVTFDLESFDVKRRGIWKSGCRMSAPDCQANFD